MTAQGNALGKGESLKVEALKGRDSLLADKTVAIAYCGDRSDFVMGMQSRVMPRGEW
jgi:hypothetical protein